MLIRLVTTAPGGSFQTVSPVAVLAYHTVPAAISRHSIHPGGAGACGAIRVSTGWKATRPAALKDARASDGVIGLLRTIVGTCAADSATMSNFEERPTGDAPTRLRDCGAPSDAAALRDVA